jgi:MFS family permease
MGMWVHLIPILTANGLPRTDAIWLGGILGVAATAGQLMSGALADRFPGHLLSAAYVFLLALASATLLIPMDSMLLALIPVVVLGIFGGAQTHILPYLTSRYFGLSSFGRLFGVVASVMGIAVAGGPMIASTVFDRTHGYHLFLIGCLPTVVVAAMLIFSLGRYPDNPGKRERAVPAPGEGTARSAA